jgi:hypothetical protein
MDFAYRFKPEIKRYGALWMLVIFGLLFYAYLALKKSKESATAPKHLWEEDFSKPDNPLQNMLDF